MKGKTALVNGGSSGIGTVICRRLSSDGFDVIAVCHPMEAEQADAWRVEQAADGYEIETLAMDFTCPEFSLSG